MASDFEVMCYKTRKCNDDKISVDLWQDPERNTGTDPNKIKTSSKTCQNVNSNAVCDATALNDTTISEHSYLQQPFLSVGLLSTHWL